MILSDKMGWPSPRILFRGGGGGIFVMLIFLLFLTKILESLRKRQAASGGAPFPSYRRNPDEQKTLLRRKGVMIKGKLVETTQRF